MFEVKPRGHTLAFLIAMKPAPVYLIKTSQPARRRTLQNIYGTVIFFHQPELVDVLGNLRVL